MPTIFFPFVLTARRVANNNTISVGVYIGNKPYAPNTLQFTYYGKCQATLSNNQMTRLPFSHSCSLFVPSTISLFLLLLSLFLSSFIFPSLLLSSDCQAMSECGKCINSNTSECGWCVSFSRCLSHTGAASTCTTQRFLTETCPGDWFCLLFLLLLEIFFYFFFVCFTAVMCHADIFPAHFFLFFFLAFSSIFLLLTYVFFSQSCNPSDQPALPLPELYKYS